MIRVLVRFPLLIAYWLLADREVLARDVRRVLQPRLDLPLPAAVSPRELAAVFGRDAFRSLFYYRLRVIGRVPGLVARLLAAVYKPAPALVLSCPDIGPGLYIAHGFATILLARRVGIDCLLSQQVTVGYSDAGGPPIIGDRVRIGAGAIIIGPVTIADDAVIGAGAVVVKDVPAGKVVGGVPAKIIEGATDRFRAQ